jgi:uncharacterized repeat protein (TIGR04076 family)
MTAKGPVPVMLRAIVAHECPVFGGGDRVVLLGRKVIRQQSTAICAYNLHNIMPLLKLLENGEDPSKYSIDIEGGHFRCTDEDCECVFQMVRMKVEDMTVPEPIRARQRDREGLPFLQRLPGDLADLFLSRATVRALDPGEVIIRQGTAGSHLFIVQSGEVEVVRENADGTELQLAVLGADECLGEMSLLTGQATNATVRAKGPSTTIFVLSADDLELAMAGSPELHRVFSRLLAERLQATSGKLEQELQRGMTGKLSMIRPTELIQTLVMTRSSGQLNLSDRSKRAGLYFVGGHVTDARTATAIGEEAFYEIVAWVSGSFSFDSSAPEPEQTITGDTMGYMMEAARRMDERGR